MNIKTRLQINTFLPIATTLIIGMILFSSANRVNKLYEKDITVYKVSKDISELNIVANEYMMNHEEWAQAQWQLKDKSLTGRLKEIELSTLEEQAILDRIRKDNDGIKALFSQLVANHEKRPGLNQEQTAISHELEDRLVGQISVKSQSMIAGASRLENIVHKQITSAQRKAIFLVMLFVVLLSVVTGATSILTGRSIIGPIRRLQEDTEVIGAGNLGHKAGTDADDEIGQLSRAFDRMTQELKKTTVSRDELVMEVSERKQAEERLQRNLGLLRSVIEGTTDIVFVKDRQGRTLMINTAGTHLFGKPVEEIVGKDNTELFPPDTARRIMDDDRRIMASGKTETYEEDATVNDITRTYLTTKGPYLDHQGNVIGIIGIAHDITERKRTDELIWASLKEKEVLLNEVHHRVKNNLQIISSLLDMSRMQTDNEEAKKLLADACNRITTMSLIHSQLYQTDRFDRIDMDRHLRETTSSLLQLCGQREHIVIDIKAPDVYLPVSQAIPCALALNELISNALEHAYRDGEKGTLEISMQRAADDTVSIRVKDDGVGIPEELDPYKSDSLGLKLVRNLVQRQLRGELRYNVSKGTEFIIEFKVSEENAKEA